MKILSAKTARFKAVVAASGQPEAATLWQSPEKDARFKLALRQNRVMTVKQETIGTKKDFGVVGYRKERNVSYLMFPKPLDEFEGKRIVGVDYDQIRNPTPKDPVRVTAAVPKKLDSAIANGRIAQHKKFRVTVRCTAVVELKEEVEASNKTAAKAAAVASVKRRSLDFSKGRRSETALRVETA